MPLIKLQDVGTCIFHRHSVVPELWIPPPHPQGIIAPEILPSWGSGYIYAWIRVDWSGAMVDESIHEDTLGDDTPFINNNLTLLGSDQVYPMT